MVGIEAQHAHGGRGFKNRIEGESEMVLPSMHAADRPLIEAASAAGANEHGKAHAGVVCALALFGACTLCDPGEIHCEGECAACMYSGPMLHVLLMTLARFRSMSSHAVQSQRHMGSGA